MQIYKLFGNNQENEYFTAVMFTIVTIIYTCNATCTATARLNASPLTAACPALLARQDGGRARQRGETTRGMLQDCRFSVFSGCECSFIGCSLGACWVHTGCTLGGRWVL